MSVQENYNWEAEMRDGTIISEGEWLNDCVRFSFLPQLSVLPRHDVIGVSMLRRFGRGFQKINMNDYEALPDQLVWSKGSSVVVAKENIEELIQPGYMIKKRYTDETWWVVFGVEGEKIYLLRDYDGRTEKVESYKYIPQENFEYVHCCVCRDFRVYVRSTDGTMLVAPSDFELYL